MAEEIDFTQLLLAEKIRLLFKTEDQREGNKLADILKLNITDPVTGRNVQESLNFSDEWSRNAEFQSTKEEIENVSITDLWNTTEGVNWDNRDKVLSFTDDSVAQYDSTGCQIEGSETVYLSELTGDLEIMRLMDRVNLFGQIYDIKFRKIDYGQYKYGNSAICTSIANAMGVFSVDKLINDEDIRKDRQNALNKKFEGTECEGEYPPYSGWLDDADYVENGWIDIDRAVLSALEDEFGYDSDASLAIQTRKFLEAKRVLTLLVLNYTSNILVLNSNNKIVDFGIRIIDKTTGQELDYAEAINKTYSFIGQNITAIFSGKLDYTDDEEEQAKCDPCQKIKVDKCTGDLQRVAQCEALGEDDGVSHTLMPQFRVNVLAGTRERSDLLNTIDPIHWTTGTQDTTEEQLPGITALREEFTEEELTSDKLITSRAFAYGAGEWNNGFVTGGVFHNIISYQDIYEAQDLEELGYSVERENLENDSIAGASPFWGHASDPHAKRDWYTNELPGWPFDCKEDLQDSSSASYPCADTEVWNGTTWTLDNSGPPVPRAFGLAGGKPDCAVTAFGTRCVWGGLRNENMPNTEIDYGFKLDVGLNPVIGSPVPTGFLISGVSDVYFWNGSEGWISLSSAKTPNVDRHSVAGVMSAFCQEFGENSGTACKKTFKEDKDFPMDNDLFSALKAFERDGGHRAAGLIGGTQMRVLPNQYDPKQGLDYNYDSTTGGQLNVGADYYGGEGVGKPLSDLRTDYDGAPITAFDAVMGLPPSVSMKKPSLNFGVSKPLGNRFSSVFTGIGSSEFENSDALNEQGRMFVPTQQVQKWKFPIVRPDGTIIFVDDSSNVNPDLLKDGDDVDNGWYDYLRASGMAFNGSSGEVTLGQISDSDLSDTFETMSWVRVIHKVPTRESDNSYSTKSHRFEDGSWNVNPDRKYPVKTIGTAYVGSECEGLATGGKTSNLLFGCNEVKSNIKYGYFKDSKYDEFDNSVLNLVYENDGEAWIRRDNLHENVYYHTGVGNQTHAVFWGGIHASVEEENAFVAFPGCDDWYLTLESMEGSFHRFGVKGLDNEVRYTSFATVAADDFGNIYWKAGDSGDETKEGIEYSDEYKATGSTLDLTGNTWDSYLLDDIGHITKVTYASKDKNEDTNFNTVIFTGGESWMGSFIKVLTNGESQLPEAEDIANLESTDTVGYFVEELNEEGFDKYEATYRPDTQDVTGFENLDQFAKKINYFLQKQETDEDQLWKYAGHPVHGGIWIWSRPTPGENLFHPTNFVPYTEATSANKEIWERHSFASGIGLETYFSDPYCGALGGPIYKNSIWTANTDTSASGISGAVGLIEIESVTGTVSGGWLPINVNYAAYNTDSSELDDTYSIITQISIFGTVPPCSSDVGTTDPLWEYVPPNLSLPEDDEGNYLLIPQNSCDDSLLTAAESVTAGLSIIPSLGNLGLSDTSDIEIMKEPYGPLPSSIYQQVVSYGTHPRDFTYSFFVTRGGNGLDQLMWGYDRKTFIERWKFPAIDTVILAMSGNNAVYGEPIPMVKKNDGSGDYERFDQHEIFQDGTLSVGTFVYPVADPLLIGSCYDVYENPLVDVIFNEIIPMQSDISRFDTTSDFVTCATSGDEEVSTTITMSGDLGRFRTWLNALPSNPATEYATHYYPVSYDPYVGPSGNEYFRFDAESDIGISSGQIRYLADSESSSIRDRAALWPWCDLLEGDASNVGKPGQVTWQYDRDGNLWLAECVSRVLRGNLVCTNLSANGDPLNRYLTEGDGSYPDSYYQELYRIAKYNKKSELIFNYEIIYNEGAGPEIIAYSIPDALDQNNEFDKAVITGNTKNRVTDFGMFGKNLNKREIDLELWSNKPLPGVAQTWASDLDERYSIFANFWKREVAGVDTKVSNLTAGIYPEDDQFGPGEPRLAIPYRHESICEMITGGIYNTTPTFPDAGTFCYTESDEIWWYSVPTLVTSSQLSLDNENFFKQRSSLVRTEKLEGLSDGMALVPAVSSNESIEFIHAQKFTNLNNGDTASRISRAVVAGPNTYGIGGFNLGKSKGIDFNGTDVFSISGDKQDILFDETESNIIQIPDYERLLKSWPWNIIGPGGRQGTKGFTDAIDEEGNYWFAMGDPQNFSDEITDFNFQRYNNSYVIAKVSSENISGFNKTALAYTNYVKASEAYSVAEKEISSFSGTDPILSTVATAEGARFREALYECILTQQGSEFYDLYVRLYEHNIPDVTAESEPDFYQEWAEYETNRNATTREVTGSFYELPLDLDTEPLPLIIQDLEIITDRDMNCITCSMCETDGFITDTSIDVSSITTSPWIQHNHDEWIAPFTESAFAGPFSLDGFNVWLTAGQQPRWGTPIWSDVEDGKIWISYRRQRVHVNEYRNHLVLMNLELSINVEEFATANTSKIPVYCTYDEFIYDLEDYEDLENVKIINEKSSHGTDCTDNVLAVVPNNLEPVELIVSTDDIAAKPGVYDQYDWDKCYDVEVRSYINPLTNEAVILSELDTPPEYTKVTISATEDVTGSSTSGASSVEISYVENGVLITQTVDLSATTLSSGFTLPSDVDTLSLEAWGGGGYAIFVETPEGQFGAGGGAGGFSRRTISDTNIGGSTLYFTVGGPTENTFAYFDECIEGVADISGSSSSTDDVEGIYGNVDWFSTGVLLNAGGGENAKIDSSQNSSLFSLSKSVIAGKGGSGFGGDINVRGEDGYIGCLADEVNAIGGSSGIAEYGIGEGGETPGGGGNATGVGAAGVEQPGSGRLNLIFLTSEALSISGGGIYDVETFTPDVIVTTTSYCSGAFACDDNVEYSDKYVEWASSFIQEYKERKLQSNSGRKENKYYFKYDIDNTYDSNTYLQPENINHVDIVENDWRRYQDGVGLGGDAPLLNTLSDETFSCNPLLEYYVGQFSFGGPEQAVIGGGFAVTADGQLSETRSFWERNTSRNTFKWNKFIINPEDRLNKNYRNRTFSPFFTNGDNAHAESTFGSIVFDVSENITIERQGSAEFKGQNSVSVTFDAIPDFLPNKDKYSVVLTPNDNVKVWWSNKTETGFDITVEFDSWTGTVDWQIVLVDNLPSEQVDEEENFGEDDTFEKFENL